MLGVPALMLGAHGGIGTSYNFIPHLFLRVWEHMREGRLKEALDVQREINEICEVYKAFGKQVYCCKLILYWQGLIDNPRLVGPGRGIAPKKALALRTALMKTSLGPTLVRQGPERFSAASSSNPSTPGSGTSRQISRTSSRASLESSPTGSSAMEL